MTGAEMIAVERQRQIEKEGWTPERDDAEHVGGGLARAAICYAEHAQKYGWNATMPPHGVSKEDGTAHYRKITRPKTWPWAAKWWKPKDPVRDLVRAGALIAAEIDRLQRGRGARPFRG